MGPNRMSTRLTRFIKYAEAQGIDFNDAIRPHEFPGRGLGLATTQKIAKGTVLMHVPIEAVITPLTFSVPKVPNGNIDGKEITVRSHAKLAAQISFGNLDDRHRAWFATWPTLEDFEKSLPLLWPEKARGTYCKACETDREPKSGNTESVGSPRGGTVTRYREDAKSCGHEGDAFAVLPPSTITALRKQLAKFSLDFAAAQHLYPDLDFSEKHIRDRWTWAWCIVNTRCFYYVKPGTDHPDDVDEAMVLVPAIDLCNHSSSGCEVSYDNHGFSVKAERMYESGEEVVTTYGSHGEDTLMVEYGFLLGGTENESDGVGIDRFVLASLDKLEGSQGYREALEEHGYLGVYTLKRDGVCWRTEVAARCTVMERGEWEMFVMGKWTDDEDVMARKRKRRKNGLKTAPTKQNAKQLASSQIREWIEQVGKEAEKSLDGIQSMDSAAVGKLFGTTDQGKNLNATADGDLETMADARYELVVKRWEQIRVMVSEALAGLEQ